MLLDLLSSLWDILVALGHGEGARAPPMSNLLRIRLRIRRCWRMTTFLLDLFLVQLAPSGAAVFLGPRLMILLSLSDTKLIYIESPLLTPRQHDVDRMMALRTELELIVVAAPSMR